MDVIRKRSSLRHKIGESSFIEFNAQWFTVEIFRSWMRQPVPSSSIKIVWFTGILKEYENPSLFVMCLLSLEIFRTTSLSIQTTVLGLWISVSRASPSSVRRSLDSLFRHIMARECTLGWFQSFWGRPREIYPSRNRLISVRRGW